MLACQQCPNVVTFIEEFLEDGHYYIVTKYQRGQDLISYLTANDIPCVSETSAKHIFTQIARGVQTIHSHNIVHRDLKHLNIFLSDNGPTPKVRIGDFGMAAYLQDDECIKKVAGTIGFMAPEVILNQNSDFKVDIWSIGIILYALICSQVPFLGKSPS